MQMNKITKAKERDYQSTHTDKEILTYKFWSSKNVFKIIAKIHLVSQAEVNDLDARVRHWAAKQHDVLRLEEKQKTEERLLKISLYWQVLPQLCTEISKRNKYDA